MKKRDLFQEKKPKKSASSGPAFPFVLDLLERKVPFVRPMFGCHSVYVGEKIVLILRDKPAYPKDNGVWLATTHEHHESLKKDFPSMRSITIFGPGPSGWQVLPKDSRDFESAVTQACEFILASDPRIGKIPAARKPKKKTTPTTKPTGLKGRGKGSRKKRA